jgi:hypothetical protein
MVVVVVKISRYYPYNNYNSPGCLAQGRQTPGCSLTDAGEDEDDEEGAGHGVHGLGERGEDAADGLEPAEDAQHAGAAEEEQEAERQAGGGQADEGEADDGEVEDGPGVAEEGPEPVGVEVDGELAGEEEDEEEVQLPGAPSGDNVM